MIEEIEKVHSQLKPVLLRNLQLLAYDQIPVLLEGPSPGIARSIPVSGRSGARQRMERLQLS